MDTAEYGASADSNPRWGESIGAAMVGGIAMGVYMMLVTALMGKGFWTPMHMIAAVFPAYRAPFPGTGASATIGFLLHMATSVFWGLVFAGITRIFPKNLAGPGISTLWGLLFGFTVWLVMGEGLGPWLSPPIDAAPAVNFLIAHLIFGMVTSWFFYAWTSAGTPVSPGPTRRPLGASPA